MRGIPVDVIQFVEWRFATRDLKTVLALLDEAGDLSGRLLRASLYLSDGSLSLLRYHLQAARTDPRETLLAAEFITGIGTEPLPVRDMSQPFLSTRNLGPGCFEAQAPDQGREAHVHGTQATHPGKPAPKAAPPRTIPADSASFHEAVTQRKFRLGKACYVVTSTQTSRKFVRCYRIEGKVANLVILPLGFVLEQLAEVIELDVAYP